MHKIRLKRESATLCDASSVRWENVISSPHVVQPCLLHLSGANLPNPSQILDPQIARPTRPSSVPRLRKQCVSPMHFDTLPNGTPRGNFLTI